MINAKTAKNNSFEALKKIAKEIITNDIEPRILKTISNGDFSCKYDMSKVRHPSEVAKLIIDELQACGYNAKYGIDRMSEFDLEISWKDV